MSIGQFSDLTGLSIHTLRHWNTVGLLVPAEVDDVSRYRRYLPSQVNRADDIRRLRDVDLPINEIQTLLAADAAAGSSTEILRRHRDRLVEQARRIEQRLDRLDHLIATKGTYMSDTQPSDRPVQVRLAVDNLAEAVAFYERLFDRQCDVRPGDDDTSRSIKFGTVDHHNLFVLVLLSNPGDVDRPAAPSTIGLFVDDIDATYERAIRGGGTSLVAPHEPDESSRCAAVADPARNWIWLDQRQPVTAS